MTTLQKLEWVKADRMGMWGGHICKSIGVLVAHP